MKQYFLTLPILFVCNAVFADAPVNSFMLFSSFPQDMKGLGAIDVDTSRPGVETWALSRDCANSATDANGYITVSQTLKIKLYSADGLTTVIAPAGLKATTGKVPDYRLAKFQCGGESPVDFYISSRQHFDPGHQPIGIPASESNYLACGAQKFFEADYTLCDEFPNWGFGLGVAKVGATKVLVLGTMVDVNYEIGVDDGLNASGFSVAAYSLADGHQIWKKTYTGTDAAGYNLFPDTSLVGDFLKTDGADEIRLAYRSGSKGWKYVYLNPTNGKTLATAILAMP